MAVEVNIQAIPSLRGIIQLTETIDREVLSDVSSFWELLTPFLAKILKTRFESENQGRWAALSPRYKAWKNKHYPGRPILQLTQKLYHAATQKGAAGNICTETPTSLTWGVDEGTTPQAGYVQSGRRAPSRIWCELEPRDEADINLNFGYWLRKGLDKKCRG